MGTRTSPPSVAALLALLLASALAAQAPVVRTGPHFVVHLHGGALAQAQVDALADAALAAAESVWPSLERLLGVKAGKPANLHLHTDEPAFRGKQKAASLSTFRDAYVDHAAAEAHVLVWPKLSAKALALVGLPDPTAHELVRSAAILVAAQFSPAAVADPWLAEVFAWGVLEDLVNGKHEFGVDPAYDTRRQPLLRKLEAREELLLKSTILDFEIAASREAAGEDDAHQCLLARTMAAASKDWAKKLLAKPPKKTTVRAEIRHAAVERAFGTDWIKTEGLFAKLHQHARPRWQLTAPMAAPRAGRLLCAGTTEQSMQFQAVELPGQGDYAVRGTFEIHPCADDAFRIMVDWDQKSMIGCFFGVGKWSIEKWSVGGDWQKLVDGKAPIHAGVPFEAAVEVGKNLRLLVGGQEVGVWEYGDRTMRGRWSLGVSDCVVWVEKLRCEGKGGK